MSLRHRIRSPRTWRSFEKTARSARRTTQTVGGLGSRNAAAADQRGGANVESVRDALVGPDDRMPPTCRGWSNQRVCADSGPADRFDTTADFRRDETYRSAMCKKSAHAAPHHLECAVNAASP